MPSLNHPHFLISVILSNCLHFPVLLFIFSLSWLGKIESFYIKLPSTQVRWSYHPHVLAWLLALSCGTFPLLSVSLNIPSLSCTPQTSKFNSCLHSTELLKLPRRLFASGVRSSSISEKIMACVSLGVMGPAFRSAFPRTRLLMGCTVQHHDYSLFFPNQFLFSFC